MFLGLRSMKCGSNRIFFIFLVILKSIIKEERKIYMPVAFNNSETKENLMRAFAGESQARNRYTFAAYQARKTD